MIDFRISTFLEVCSCMNFTRAAENLHITQPAVSQHIKYLEDLYQAPLFIHEGKKFRLTNAGEVLYQTAITLKSDEKNMIAQMQSEAPEHAPLIFGATMTIGEYVITNSLTAYIESHPDANIRMVLSNTSDLLAKLQAGEINFALVEGYFASDEYDHLTYSVEDFIPVCSSAHTFKKVPKVLKDLLNERLLIREPGSGTRDILEKNLEVKNIKVSDFKHVAEINSMPVIIQLLENDCGVSFLYKTAVSKQLENSCLHELKLMDFQMQHDFTFIWNKGSIFATQYQEICDFLQSHRKI